MGESSKPVLQLQIKLPIVLTQFALVTFPSPQFPLFILHSSMSKIVLYFIYEVFSTA